MYKAIQYNGSACKLTTLDSDNDPTEYPDIILYDDVVGDHQCYFVRSDSYFTYGILGSNSDMHVTSNVYQITSSGATHITSEYLDSSTPSDYYTNVKTRNFTLTQRS